MFVQVIQGPVSDATAARAQFEKWMTELAPGAIGWLGSTAGVTDDGTLVALARFESEEAARQNSDRPEQTEFTGPLQHRQGEGVRNAEGGDDDGEQQ